ncbi:hypothetical protein Rsub_00102 [Raphidocelis subcapitata]|uniref:R3H domain-containing protein n=1 Tax=Raphidocelis subcapitata TaxID=307507 RepID=A0A2V0NJJ5_9CHLO|nr:hypothetical protein Rsub_00102 [Raphidocelis subcapitata]|eukprot:GBF87391.1 hypothetical protein Rsub_00102 [Raphidocelis subcapitata]
MEWEHLPPDLLLRALQATDSWREVARAGGVCKAWGHVASEPDLWRAAAARDLGVAPALLRGRDPKAAFVEALTGEAWVWGLLPHGGPCPLPGGDSCASSLMAHTASGERCAAPQRLTYVSSGSGGTPRSAAAARCGRAGPFAPAGAGAGTAAAAAAAAGAGAGASDPPEPADASGPGAAGAGAAAAARASPRAVAAGEDFILLLGAGGGVWDSRHAAKHRHPNVKLSVDIGAALRGYAITSIAAGQHHALALADGGEVFGWGACASGQLGCGQRRAWVGAPIEVAGALRPAWQAAGSGERVYAVAAGLEHSALLTTAGAVLLAGRNGAGECAQPPGGAGDCVPAWAAAELPAGPAAAVALGWRNTAVVTAAGRVLVCGDNAFGQHGASPAAPGRFSDAGPDARWHGLARRGQAPRGGGSDAGAAVVAAAVGRGAVYALTDAGEVFHWGAPPGGGRGGGAPSKVPGVRGATAVAASCAGRFAAVVNGGGRLLTFGAGKSGQLGHGGAGRSGAAREVKALRGRRVVAVACGTDCMTAVTAFQPSRCGACSPPPSPAPSGALSDSDGDAFGCSDGPGGGEQPDSPGTPPQAAPSGARGSAFGAARSALSLRGLPPVGWPRDPRPGGASDAGGSAPSGGARGSRGDSRWHGAAPAAAASRARAPPRRHGARRGAGRAPVAGGGGSSGEEEGAGAGAGAGPDAARRAAPDRGMCLAVRRVLRAFAADPRQREILLPPGLSSADRFHIHVTAQEWGFGHESRDAEGGREMRIWKPSRTRPWGGAAGGGGAGAGGGGGGASGSGAAGGAEA